MPRSVADIPPSTSLRIAVLALIFGFSSSRAEGSSADGSAPAAKPRGEDEDEGSEKGLKNVSRGRFASVLRAIARRGAAPTTTTA